jgi:plasmid maintenance system antidote protein VapI
MHASEMFDRIIADNRLRNDAALAHRLEASPSDISRMRNGIKAVGATMIVNLHETFGIPIATIKNALGMKSLASLVPK